jgi:hypothetical protein
MLLNGKSGDLSEQVERKNTLKELSQILCNFNQQDDIRRTVGHLSLEFFKHAMMLRIMSAKMKVVEQKDIDS